MTTPPWWVRGLVGFDVETTGVNVETDRVVTANVTYHHPEQETRVRNFLLDPGVEIPEQATAVHGVSTEHARTHGQPAAEGIAAIIALLNQCKRMPLVGFNLTYDLTLLDREARRHGLEPFVPVTVIDGFVLDKHLDPYRRGSRKLDAVCAHYGVTLENAHTADADALASVLVARAMGAGSSQVLAEDATTLHQHQIGWRADQQANFEAYLARKGTPETLRREWPLIPFEGPVAA